MKFFPQSHGVILYDYFCVLRLDKSYRIKSITSVRSAFLSVGVAKRRKVEFVFRKESALSEGKAVLMS